MLAVCPVKIVGAFVNTVISEKLRMEIPSAVNFALPELLDVNIAVQVYGKLKIISSPLLLWSDQSKTPS